MVQKSRSLGAVVPMVICSLVFFKGPGVTCLTTSSTTFSAQPSPPALERSRRGFLVCSFGSVIPWTTRSGVAEAAVTDETDNFADNWWSSGITGSTTNTRASQSLPSDEIEIRVSKDKLKAGLGLELADIEFKTNRRVYVKSVALNSLAGSLGIQKNWVVVSLNGKSTERTNAEGVALMLSNEMKSGSPSGDLIFVFRDPSVFREKLGALAEGESVTTQVAPAGDTTQRNLDGSVRRGESVSSQEDQRIVVTQLIPPKMCSRKATIDDLVEISYLGIVQETGQVFDGSAIKINGEGIPGRGDDVSLYFVLGKQPFGQFPPGWDVGMQGMCVGERRRVVVPPSLAYGKTGVPKRGIPPDATLQYDITLVSLNGLSTPQ